MPLLKLTLRSCVSRKSIFSPRSQGSSPPSSLLPTLKEKTQKEHCKGFLPG